MVGVNRTRENGKRQQGQRLNHRFKAAGGKKKSGKTAVGIFNGTSKRSSWACVSWVLAALKRRPSCMDFPIGRKEFRKKKKGKGGCWSHTHAFPLVRKPDYYNPLTKAVLGVRANRVIKMEEKTKDSITKGKVTKGDRMMSLKSDQI